MENLKENARPNTARVELLFASTKAALALVPYVGGSLAEVVGYFGQRYITERQNQFLDGLLRQLDHLATQIDDFPEKLINNASFYSTLSYACATLQFTTDQEKIKALRHAVLNAAMPDAPNENLQLLFVRFVHELTPWHLALLACIQTPLEWAKQHNIPIHDKSIHAGSLFEAATRGQLQPDGLHTTLLSDLYVRGLATTGVDPYGPLYPHGEEDTHPHITELGRLFLAFIASPLKGRNMPEEVHD